MTEGFLLRNKDSFLLFGIAILFLALLITNRDVLHFLFEKSVFKQLLLLKTIIFSWVLVGVAVYLFTKRAYHIIAIYSIAMLATAILVFSRNNIFFDLGGDNWYMNALVTKHKNFFNFLIDSTIKDIPSYLSPLYFFLAGKFAEIFNLDSPRSLLVFSFIGVVCMPLLYYYLLKRNFQSHVVVVTVFIGCAFYHYELILKPYQSISALVALIFYYNFLTQVNEKTNLLRLVSIIFVGVFIFFLYYYHFTYLAIAFFLQVFFERVLGASFNLKATIKRFGVYLIIFLIGMIFFIGPHIMAVLRVGSSHKIFFGSTSNLDFIFLSFPIILGLFDLVKSINEEYSFKTFILICSLAILFVSNIFLELFVEYNIHVFKIQHIIYIILLPHFIRFVFNYLFAHSTHKLSILAQKVLVVILLLFSTNEWISYCFNYKKDSNQYRFWSEIASHTQSEIDLKNKVVFSTAYNSDLEYGALIPNFRFLPVNNDYGSPASQLAKRINVMKALDSLKGNPSGFANCLMNNEIQKIDFLIWNEGLNVLSWEEVSKIGEDVVVKSVPIEKGLLSTRYFEKIENVNFLYRLNHNRNFEKKSLDSLLFLEKVSEGLIKSNYILALRDELSVKGQLYTSSDVKDIIFFFKKGLRVSSQQMDSVIEYARPVLKRQYYEAESLPLGIDGIPTKTFDLNASGNFCRRFTPDVGLIKAGNVLVYGPYGVLPKGKYHLKISLKSNLDQAIPVLNVDGYSSEAQASFFKEEITSSQIFSAREEFIMYEIDFEVSVNLTDFEIRFFVDQQKNAQISVDKVQIDQME